jgi:hypothetical protein
MTNIEDTVVVHGKRIATLESDVSDLKVDTGKLSVTLSHQDERQQERFVALSTSQLELKDIMKARAASDEARAAEARKYREERERQEIEANRDKAKWVQSLLTPQTLILIIVVIAGIFGVKGLDLMETTGMPVAAEAP